MNIENLEKYYKGFNLLSRKNEIDFESYIFNEMKKNNIEKLDYPILIGIKITDKCNPILLLSTCSTFSFKAIRRKKKK
ncbi:hypothetical protein [Clostridium perfringens]|uniref:hypothetical protein n=1 Tax=Clostridium perfringens TaxID=1502 RepID=UPI0023DDC7DC|nr:hypothetical protein [Clostridium perfringens]